MDQRILVPFDSSGLGTLALDRAFEEHPDAEVTVLHVIDTRQSTYAIEGGLSESVQQARQRIAERMIAEAERRAQDHGRTVETVIERATLATLSSSTPPRTMSTT